MSISSLQFSGNHCHFLLNRSLPLQGGTRQVLAVGLDPEAKDAGFPAEWTSSLGKCGAINNIGSTNYLCLIVPIRFRTWCVTET